MHADLRAYQEAETLRARLQAVATAATLRHKRLRLAYRAGWRKGVGGGLISGICLGALAMHAGTELVALIQALP